MLLLVERLHTVAGVLVEAELGLIFLSIKLRRLVPCSRGFEFVDCQFKDNQALLPSLGSIVYRTFIDRVGDDFQLLWRGRDGNHGV